MIITVIRALILSYLWAFIALMIWSIAWKGVALWKAASRKELGWFVVLLIVNTAGILEIIYIFLVAKKSKSIDAPKTQKSAER